MQSFTGFILTNKLVNSLINIFIRDFSFRLDLAIQVLRIEIHLLVPKTKNPKKSSNEVFRRPVNDSIKSRDALLEQPMENSYVIVIPRSYLPYGI